jgi:hypothetical protein
MISWLSPILRPIWKFGIVCWVCRVPLASTVAALALIVLTPQGRDLFADLGISWQWAVFFLLCFCWAWIVHGGARRALQCDDWVPEAHQPGGLTVGRRMQLQASFHWPAVWVPRLLGIATLLLIGWGICRTWRNMRGASGSLDEATVATNLTFALLFVTLVLTGVFIWLVVNWRTRINRVANEAAVAPCLTGRTPLFAGWFGDGTPIPQTQIDTFITWARRIIFLVIVFAVAFPLLAAAWLPRLFFLPLLFAGIVLFFGELASWSHRLRTPFLLVAVGISLLFVWATEHYNDVRWIKDTASADHRGRQVSFNDAVDRWRAANGCAPPHDAKECPRPILVAGAGGASRAAFLTASVVGSLLDLDHGDLSEIKPLRPRIFAISSVSGSSVGAAVMRAALVDALHTQKPTAPPCVEARADGPSAGWLGTSWFGTWAKAHDAGTHFDVTTSWRDCFQRILAGDFLTPVAFGLAYRDNFPTPLWGDRAQLLEQSIEIHYHRTTGRGHATICREEGTERGPTILKAAPEASEEAGLCRPFGYLFDGQGAAGDGTRWIPLLFLNATSVTTGRRIIVSDVKIGAPYKPGSKDDLLPFAYDLWELRAAKKQAPTSTTELSIKRADLPYNAGREPDIRLSTAAGLSARFPLISPPGYIRDLGGRNLVDEAVDGGYFENDGLATIADVAQAMKSVAPGLDPVVLHIVNNPLPKTGEDPIAPGRPPLPQDSGTTPLEGITSIFRTLTTTESGHEDGHEAYLNGVVGEDHVFRIVVQDLLPKADQQDPPFTGTDKALADHFCPRPVKQDGYMEFIAVSWWMSEPVQAYLDTQLCIHSNVRQLICEVQGKDLVNGKCEERKPRDASPQSG